ncbi:MAG: polyphosphate polymerase domain-containing protein [Clostridia bacterium]|nr:polyphosphate polymerase domain-containing protein [Clostridia bacterium]
MDYGDFFKRYEIKYLITDSQRERIDRALAEHAQPDRYGNTAIRNIYYDTPDYRLIRRSLEKPTYKEKLRVRSYGTPQKDGKVFVELKKKYKSVTYKRRVQCNLSEAESWLNGDGHDICGQIPNEIDYALKFYRGLVPAVYISYDRQAFTGIQERDFRITFDKNILWRKEDLSLPAGAYGEALLPEGYTLMELKTPDSFPLWFTKVLDECRLYNTHFSKYGSAYMALSKQKMPLYGEVAKSNVYRPAVTGEIIYV